VDLDEVSISEVNENVFELDIQLKKERWLELQESENLYLDLTRKTDISKTSFVIYCHRYYNLGVLPPQDPAVEFSFPEETKMKFEFIHGRMPEDKRTFLLQYMKL
jgi:hypothetical protein